MQIIIRRFLFIYILLDLKLITDLVPNHSSYKCKWFEKSINREGIYSNYYIWKNASNQNDVIQKSATPIPPNNWVIMPYNVLREVIEMLCIHNCSNNSRLITSVCRLTSLVTP